MCGRATNEDELQDIALGTAAAVADGEVASWRPSYNIAITNPVPVVALRGGERVLRVARWGLVPKWVMSDEKARESMRRCFNARGETLDALPSFRAAYRARRCLVVVTGFFEWEKLGAKKGDRRPYWIHPAGDARYFTFAGLYETWKHTETGEVWLTAAIVTTEPNARMAMIHDRMPVILEGGDAARWLDPETPHDDLQRLIAPSPDGSIAVRPVGAAVGNVRAQGPALIEPLVPTPGELPLGRASRVG